MQLLCLIHLNPQCLELFLDQQMLGNCSLKKQNKAKWINKQTEFNFWKVGLISVQFSHSVVSDSLRPHESQHTRPPCPSPTPGVHPNPCPFNHLILCRPLLLLPPIPLSIRVFSNELTLRMGWPKYWSFSFSISPSKEHPGWSPLGWI